MWRRFVLGLAALSGIGQASPEASLLGFTLSYDSYTDGSDTVYDVKIDSAYSSSSTSDFSAGSLIHDLARVKLGDKTVDMIGNVQNTGGPIITASQRVSLTTDASEFSVAAEVTAVINDELSFVAASQIGFDSTSGSKGSSARAAFVPYLSFSKLELPVWPADETTVVSDCVAKSLSSAITVSYNGGLGTCDIVSTLAAGVSEFFVFEVQTQRRLGNTLVDTQAPLIYAMTVIGGSGTVSPQVTSFSGGAPFGSHYEIDLASQLSVPGSQLVATGLPDGSSLSASGVLTLRADAGDDKFVVCAFTGTPSNLAYSGCYNVDPDATELTTLTATIADFSRTFGDFAGVKSKAHASWTSDGTLPSWASISNRLAVAGPAAHCVDVQGHLDSGKCYFRNSGVNAAWLRATHPITFFAEGDKLVFRADPFYPIDYQMLGNEFAADNVYYEHNGYFSVYLEETLDATAGDVVYFKANGYLLVELVLDGGSTTTLSFDEAGGVRSSTLSTGIYTVKIYYLHATDAYEPKLAITLPNKRECDVSTAPKAFDYPATQAFNDGTLAKTAEASLGASTASLVPASVTNSYQAFGVAYKSLVPLSGGFVTQFKVKQPTALGSDYPGFVLRISDDDPATFGGAAFFGYAGEATSANQLAIEFDYEVNNDASAGDNQNDPNYHHISIHAFGKISEDDSGRFISQTGDASNNKLIDSVQIPGAFDSTSALSSGIYYRVTYKPSPETLLIEASTNGASFTTIMERQFVATRSLVDNIIKSDTAYFGLMTGPMRPASNSPTTRAVTVEEWFVRTPEVSPNDVSVVSSAEQAVASLLPIPAVWKARDSCGADVGVLATPFTMSTASLLCSFDGSATCTTTTSAGEMSAPGARFISQAQSGGTSGVLRTFATVGGSFIPRPMVTRVSAAWASSLTSVEVLGTNYAGDTVTVNVRPIDSFGNAVKYPSDKIKLVAISGLSGTPSALTWDNSNKKHVGTLVPIEARNYVFEAYVNTFEDISVVSLPVAIDAKDHADSQVTVNPRITSVKAGATVTFTYTLRDQFGNLLTVQPTGTFKLFNAGAACTTTPSTPYKLVCDYSDTQAVTASPRDMELFYEGTKMTLPVNGQAQLSVTASDETSFPHSRLKIEDTLMSKTSPVTQITAGDALIFSVECHDPYDNIRTSTTAMSITYDIMFGSTKIVDARSASVICPFDVTIASGVLTTVDAEELSVVVTAAPGNTIGQIGSHVSNNEAFPVSIVHGDFDRTVSTRTFLTPGTIDAGTEVRVQLFLKDAYGNAVLPASSNGIQTGDIAVDWRSESLAAVASVENAATGEYLVKFTPTVATYDPADLSVLVNGLPVQDALTLTVLPDQSAIALPLPSNLYGGSALVTVRKDLESSFWATAKDEHGNILDLQSRNQLEARAYIDSGLGACQKWMDSSTAPDLTLTIGVVDLNVVANERGVWQTKFTIPDGCVSGTSFEIILHVAAAGFDWSTVADPTDTNGATFAMSATPDFIDADFKYPARVVLSSFDFTAGTEFSIDVRDYDPRVNIDTCENNGNPESFAIMDNCKIDGTRQDCQDGQFSNDYIVNWTPSSTCTQLSHGKLTPVGTLSECESYSETNVNTPPTVLADCNVALTTTYTSSTAVDNQNGLYNLPFAATKAGIYRLSVSNLAEEIMFPNYYHCDGCTAGTVPYNSYLCAGYDCISDPNFAITNIVVKPAAASAAASALDWKFDNDGTPIGANNIEAGRAIRLEVTARDTYGNLIVARQVNVTVDARTVAGNVQIPATAALTDANTGTVTVTLTPTKASASDGLPAFTATVTLADGASSSSRSFSFVVQPTTLDSANSVVTFPQTVTAGEELVFSVEPRDTYNNKLWSRPAEFDGLDFTTAEFPMCADISGPVVLAAEVRDYATTTRKSTFKCTAKVAADPASPVRTDVVVRDGASVYGTGQVAVFAAATDPKQCDGSHNINGQSSICDVASLGQYNAQDLSVTTQTFTFTDTDEFDNVRGLNCKDADQFTACASGTSFTLTLALPATGATIVSSATQTATPGDWQFEVGQDSGKPLETGLWDVSLSLADGTSFRRANGSDLKMGFEVFAGDVHVSVTGITSAVIESSLAGIIAGDKASLTVKLIDEWGNPIEAPVDKVEFEVYMYLHKEGASPYRCTGDVPPELGATNWTAPGAGDIQYDALNKRYKIDFGVQLASVFGEHYVEVRARLNCGASSPYCPAALDAMQPLRAGTCFSRLRVTAGAVDYASGVSVASDWALEQMPILKTQTLKLTVYDAFGNVARPDPDCGASLRLGETGCGAGLDDTLCDIHGARLTQHWCSQAADCIGSYTPDYDESLVLFHCDGNELALQVRGVTPVTDADRRFTTLIFSNTGRTQKVNFLGAEPRAITFVAGSIFAPKTEVVCPDVGTARGKCVMDADTSFLNTSMAYAGRVAHFNMTMRDKNERTVFDKQHVFAPMIGTQDRAAVLSDAARGTADMVQLALEMNEQRLSDGSVRTRDSQSTLYFMPLWPGVLSMNFKITQEDGEQEENDPSEALMRHVAGTGQGSIAVQPELCTATLNATNATVYDIVPRDYVRCVISDKCVADIAECDNAEDKSFANIASCVQTGFPECPSHPGLCVPDGLCPEPTGAADASLSLNCKDVASHSPTHAATKLAIDLHVASYDDCPSRVICPVGAKLCGDGLTCVGNLDTCPFNAFVDVIKADMLSKGYKACAGGRFVLRSEDCPSMVTCAVNEVLCGSNNECIEYVDALASGQYSATALKCQEMPRYANVTDGMCHLPPSSGGVSSDWTQGIVCPTGECRLSFDQCPTLSTCARGETKCADGNCVVGGLAACENSNAMACLPGQYKCSNGMCAGNSLLCPAATLCPANTVKCDDGSCASSVRQCPLASEYVCENGEFRCPHSNQCVSSLAECAVQASCPFERPVRCADGACRATAAECAAQTGSCPAKAPLRCSDGSCRTSFAQCSALPACPEDMSFRCPDGSCRPDFNMCMQEAAPEETGSCAADEVRCATGHCAKSLGLCPQVPTCPPGRTLCYDMSCRSPENCARDNLNEQRPTVRDLQYLPVLLSKREYVVCPNGISRRKKLADCPTGMVCPKDRPVLCFDNTCRASFEECPTLDEGKAECELEPAGESLKFARCPDGSCASTRSFRCTEGVTCRPDEFLCSDNTCRKSPEDCVAPPACPEGTFFCAGTGTCLSDRRGCQDVYVSAPVSAEAPVRCANGDSVASVAECPSSVSTAISGSGNPHWGCPRPQDFRCPDGSCSHLGCEGRDRQCSSLSAEQLDKVAAIFEDGGLSADAQRLAVRKLLPGVDVPQFPFTCGNGACAPRPSECARSNGCPFDRPVRCGNGACVSDSGKCANHLGVDQSDSNRCVCHKEPGAELKIGAADDIMEILNELADGDCTQRCENGMCVPPGHATLKCSALPRCPAWQPVRCWNGLCVETSALCPLAFDSNADEQCKDPAKPVACADGTCRASGELCGSISQCPLRIKSGTKATKTYRCPDGHCTADLSDCGVSEYGTCDPDSVRNKVCPPGLLVDTLRSCVPGSSSSCIQVHGGMCVADLSDCLKIENSCPLRLPEKLESGECAKNSTSPPIIDVGSANGCDDGYVRCPFGECVPTGQLTQCLAPVPSFSASPGDGETVCVNSGNVTSLDSYGDECLTVQNCPVDKPFLCADQSGNSGQRVCKQYPSSVSGVRLPGVLSAITSSHVCDVAVVCDEARPFRCADGTCAVSSEFCSAMVCPFGTVRHPTTLQCVPQSEVTLLATGDEMPVCPPGAPVMCSNGLCVSDGLECPSEQQLARLRGGLTCAADQVRCVDGYCANNNAECVSRTDRGIRKNRSSPEATARAGFCPYICSDGMCVEHSSLCPMTEACPASRPLRCPDGACVAVDSLTGNSDVSSLISSLCANNQPTDSCSGDEVRCAHDGVCRTVAECKEIGSFGCSGSTALQCPDGTCAANTEECFVGGALKSRERWLRYEKSESVTVSLPVSADASFSAAERDGESVLRIAAVSGSLQQQDGSVSQAQFFVRPVPTSDLKPYYSLVHFSRRVDLGDVTTLEQKVDAIELPFDRSVMSVPFQCFVEGSTVQPFAVPLTVRAVIDRDIVASQGVLKYSDELVHDEDVCLARLDEARGTWVCESFGVAKVTGDTVESQLSTCRGEQGAVFAFVFAPKPIDVELDLGSNWWGDNWGWFLMIILIPVLVLGVLGYCIFRCSRYRGKYHRERDEVEDANAQLDEIVEGDEEGIAHFGQLGPGTHVQSNPLAAAQLDPREAELEEERKRMKDELERQRQETRLAQQDIELADDSMFEHRVELGGAQMDRRNV
ncbi:MAG: hypothetical protein MHM6MM_002033 [Cercozoa sp. M6MM]